MKNTNFKGFLLNFAYEGSYIMPKLFLFCLIFYLTQILIGYNLFINQTHLLFGTQNFSGTGYIKYSDMFNESIMPYILTAFAVVSYAGIFYIFRKDKAGANRTNALYTLPFPRYCNFFAKLFYCILCPVSVYVMQILANITIMNFHTDTIGFRNNEIFLSTQFEGVYQALFSPSPVMVWVALIMVFLASACFYDQVSRSISTDAKINFIFSCFQYAVIYSSFRLLFYTNTEIENIYYIYAISMVIICILVHIILSYRKVSL